MRPGAGAPTLGTEASSRCRRGRPSSGAPRRRRSRRRRRPRCRTRAHQPYPPHPPPPPPPTPRPQQPAYPDPARVAAACDEIKAYPPLIFAGECRTLQDRLARAARGDAFILQGGDCAEAFTQFSANRIRDTYRVLLQMSVVLMFGGGVPVVKLGRMAGQFAKPRSADMEDKDGVSLPSYRGDIINGPEFTPEARVPDPFRLVRAYNQSAATLNLLRGFSTGGYAGLTRIAQWNLDFMANSDEGKAYMDLAKRVDEAIQFMQACGLDANQPIMKETEFFTSHECLLLDYEEALTR
jgi:3-deoxy-7-phosphoheptulonate synthase